ncbi:MAG: hypothetical protein ACTSVB_07170 [Candidatus Heimdallarchaeaceae archaeon]
MLSLRNVEATINKKILDKSRYLDIIITVIVSVLILVLSCYVKNLISEKVKFLSKTFFYSFTNQKGENITWYLESYTDASYYYEPFLQAFSFEGWNPYKRYLGSELDYYMYGPIFIYSKYITLLIIGFIHPNLSQTELVKASIKWSAITIDSLSVMMLYIVIINLKFLKEKLVLKHIIGFLGSILLMLAPINLYYSDTLYLNGPLMTFFALIGLNYFLKEKYTLSGIFLSLSFLSKQLSLFLVIQFFILIWKSKDLKTVFTKFLNPFVLTSFLLSIPWIFITPILYIGRIFAAGHPQFYLNEELSIAQSLANSISSLGCELCAQIYWYLNFVMIPFLVFYGGCLLFAHFNAKEIMESEENIILYTTLSVLILHTFISRGIYKYYNSYINVFFILSIIVVSYRIIKYMFKKEKGFSAKEKITLSFIIFLCSILFTILLWGENLLIMKIQRERHPLILLLMTIIFSFSFKLDNYKKLFIKKNYRILVIDVKSFFIYIYSSTKKKFLKMVKIICKKLKKEND